MKIVLTTFFAVLMTTLGFAQDAPQKTAEVEGVSEFRLSNGCRLLLYPDASAKVVTVNMTVMVGSRHEGYGETGMAHLLEHMLFKGTPLHTDIDRELKERGAVDMNGTTWYDRTNYYETLPASDQNTEWAIEVEADRLVNCFIRGKDLFAEMTVVRSEFEMSENSPRQILMQRILANAYEWHNYGKSVIGNKADIELVPLPSLRAFYKKYYRPENVVVIVSGKFNVEKTLGHVQKHFGKLDNPKSKLPKTYTSEPTQDGERVVYLRRVGGVPTTGAAYHVPSVAHPDFAAVKVLSWILGDEPSGRLYKQLVKTGKADSVEAWAGESHDPGTLYCGATFKVADNNEQAAREFAQNFAKLIETTAADGIDAADVERAKADFAKQKEEEILDSQNFAMTLSDWSAYGDWRLYFIDRDRLEKVTVEDVQRVAKKYLKRSNRTLGLYLPTKEPQRSTIEATPSVAKLVESYTGKSSAGLAAASSFEPTPANIAAKMTTGELESGLPYSLLEKSTRGDKFHLKMTLNYGNKAAFDTREKINAAGYLGDVMTMGTKSKNVEALDDLQTQLKADISIGSQELGELVVTVNGRKEFFAETMDLVHEMLRDASFPEDEFKLMLSEEMSFIGQMKNDPGMIAQTTVSRAMNPVEKNHPDYVPTIAEMSKELRAVKLETIRDLYKLLNGSAGRVTITGAFDKETAIAKLNNLVDGWKSDVTFERFLSESHKIESKTQSIETPDQASAMYFAGANIDSRSTDKDWEALMIAADIIGGGSLDSRLAQFVREEKGLSYQVGCQFQAGDHDRAGAFFTYATTNPANKAALVDAVRKVYQTIENDGFNKEELESAKKSYVERIEAMLGEDEAMNSIIHRYGTLNQEIEFLAKRLERVENLTLDEVNVAAKKLIDSSMVTVLAGDFANAKAADKSPAAAAASAKGMDSHDAKAIQATIAKLKKAVDKGDFKQVLADTTEKAKNEMAMETFYMASSIGSQAAQMGVPRLGKKLKSLIKEYGLEEIELPGDEADEDTYAELAKTVGGKLKEKAADFIVVVRKETAEITGAGNDFAGKVAEIKVDGNNATAKIKSTFPPEMGGPEFLIQKFEKVDDKWLYGGMDQEAMMKAESANVGAMGEEIEISGKTFDGKDFDLNDLRGKVVLVDFWGTWCGPCVAELPKLKKLSAALKDKSFAMLGIAVDEKDSMARFFKRKGKLPWKNIVDPDGEIADEYGVQAFPTKLLIDAKGVHIAVPNSTAELLKLLAKELKLSDDELKEIRKELKKK